MIASEYDVEGPTTLGFDIRLTDQDVILARTDLMTDLSNVQQGHFSRNFVVNTFAGPVTILRGWASVDAKVRSKTCRFVTTHLESLDQTIASAQAAELVQVPSNTTLPVVIAGDFNSAAAGGPDPSKAYDSMIAAGFTDTWSTAHPDDPGYTFPLHLEDQPPPSPPAPDSSPTERIDLVLSRGGVGVLGAQLVGSTTASLTPSGLWPSDHAGVVATLRIP